MPAIRTWALGWLRRYGLAVGLVFVYLYPYPYFPALHSANELPRVYLVKAMVDEGRFAIDTGVRRWGETSDVSVRPGVPHVYSNKAPGSSMLAIPAYAVLVGVKAIAGGEPTLAEMLWVCRVWTGAVPTLLFLWLLWRFLARWAPDPATRRLIIVAYALGSMAMTYSVLFIAHQLSAVLAATAWILCIRVLDEGADARWMLAAGLAAGAGVLVDYQAAFATLPVAAWVIVRLVRDPRRWVIIAYAVAGAALPIAILLWYHQAAFGSPWATGYTYAKYWGANHETGLLGMDRPRLEAVWGSLLAPDNGLFVFCPLLLVAVPGWWAMFHRRNERGIAATTLAVAAVYLAFLVSLKFWRGGWQLGPRYVTVMLPFWLPAIAVAAVAAERRWWTRGVVVGLAGVGVVVYAISCALYPHFPDTYFRNPLYEITFRLLREGWAPWNAGWLIGLRGVASLVPYLAVVTVLWTWVALPSRAAWRSALLAMALTAAILAAYAELPRGDAKADAAYRRAVAGAMPR